MERVKTAGTMEPLVVIQQDEQACLPACLVSVLGGAETYDEASIVNLLEGVGLYNEGVGLVPAEQLDASLEHIGLAASHVFGANLFDESAETIHANVLAVNTALDRGDAVLLAHPKRRPNQLPFLHFAMITGRQSDGLFNDYAVMDPSDIDGGLGYLDESGMRLLVTPHVSDEYSVPVMAWGIRSRSSEPFATPQKYESDMPGLVLLDHPMYHHEHLGIALPPGTKHPTSTALPTTADTMAFKTLGDVVLSRNGGLPDGYPRFVVCPEVQRLSLETFGRADYLPFPTLNAAQDAAYLHRTYGNEETEIIARNGVFWLNDASLHRDAWQYAGLGMSSRQALAIREGRPEQNTMRRSVAETTIRHEITTHTGIPARDIYLFPTGMAAVYTMNQVLAQVAEGAPGIQFGLPYTDTYEQRKFGPERSMAHNLIGILGSDYQKLTGLTDGPDTFRGIYTEVPTNPLLWTPDLRRVANIADNRIPVVIDDTVGTMFNIDDTLLPDAVVARVTSLTKFFSSVGDVMGGAIALRADSPHYGAVKEKLDNLYEDTLWYEDAEVLARNSQYFAEVMPRINRSGEHVARALHEEWTGSQKPIQSVYYPTLTSPEAYEAVQKAGGGASGLVSLRFNEPGVAYKFFDNLYVTKGPSLGTYYTLGCLYTQLAYKQVESMQQYGVVPDLVRISLGIEDPDDLLERITYALEQATKN